MIVERLRAAGIALVGLVAGLLLIGGVAVAAPPRLGLCEGLSGDALTRCLYSDLDGRLAVLEPSPSPDPSPTVPAAVKPAAANTGPRIAITRTLTTSQALAELRTTKRLSGVKITGGLTFSGADGRGWVIEDSRVEGGLYTVRGYVGLTAFTGTQAERPKLDYVEIVGNGAIGTSRSSACIYGQDLVIDHADVFGCDDGAKPTGRLDLLDSWLHDLDKPSGSHCDGIQIRNGTAILIKGNRIDAYIGYSSDGSGGVGDWGSGGLETGSLTGPIQARFEGNWWAGGRFTVRGATDAELPQVDYVFRDNQFMQFGTIVSLNRTDLPPSQYGPLSENLGDFDDSNIWEHTGQPVQ